MASNDQHQEQRRQLIETIKKTLELQENGKIPHLIDPLILENLNHNDPGEYLEMLRKTAEDIRKLLSEIKQPNAITHKQEAIPSENPSGQKYSINNIISESQALSGASSYSSLSKTGKTNIWSQDEAEEEDLYENTGPGSRVGRLHMPDNGKLFMNSFYLVYIICSKFDSRCE